MESANNKEQRGQALVELTVAAVLIIAFIFVGSNLSLFWLKKFKHHHLETNTPLKSQTSVFDLKLERNLLFFQLNDPSTNAQQTRQNQGGEINRISIDNQEIFLLESANETILFEDKYGVRLCRSNCH